MSQHSRDKLLLSSLVQYFNCGVISLDSRNPVNSFTVSRFSDITDKILPFLAKYPLQGSKSSDYIDFCLIAGLIKDKAHLTQEGVKHISQIKAGMNKERN